MNDTNHEPLVKGGQGRSADELTDSAGWIMALAVVAAVTIFAAVVAGLLS